MSKDIKDKYENLIKENIDKLEILKNNFQTIVTATKELKQIENNIDNKNIRIILEYQNDFNKCIDNIKNINKDYNNFIQEKYPNNYYEIICSDALIDQKDLEKINNNKKEYDKIIENLLDNTSKTKINFNIVVIKIKKLLNNIISTLKVKFNYKNQDNNLIK
ncbi:MAG: hypothetical protein U1E31_00955 [Rickettsiales bacterium]